MKKTILSAVVVAIMAVSAIAQNNDNNLDLATAQAAIRSQCDNSTGNLQAYTTVVSACFVDGVKTNYNFYRVPNCPPNTFCIAVIIPIGTVQIGCDGSVISVSCNTFVIQ